MAAADSSRRAVYSGWGKASDPPREGAPGVSGLGSLCQSQGHREVPHQNLAREPESSARVAVPGGGSEKETLGKPTATQPALSSCPVTSCGTLLLAGTEAEPRAISLQGDSGEAGVQGALYTPGHGHGTPSHLAESSWGRF